MRIPFNRRVIGGAILLSGAWLVASPVTAEDLGLIQVESTTIDDRFENKREEASNIAVISGEEVDAAHTENIQQLLQSIPGITTEVQSGDSIKIHIRGVENQVFMGEKPGVAVVIDGVPVFERTGRVNIDLDNIESIKVIKGGASYLFGDDALAGAVIITTKRGAKQAGYRLAGEAGSFNTYKTLMRAGFAGEQGNGHIQASRRATDGYYDDSASQADYVNGKLQYYVDDSSDVSFGFEKSNRKKNSHGTVTGVTAAQDDPRSEDPAYNDYTNRYDVSLGKYYLTYSNDIGAADNILFNIYHFDDNTEYFSSPVRNTEDDYNYFNDYDQVQRGVKTEYRAGGQSIAWMAGLDLRDNSYDNKVKLIDCGGISSFVCTTGEIGNYTADGQTTEKVTAAYGEFRVKATEELVLTANGRTELLDLNYQYSDYSIYTNTVSSGDKDASFYVNSMRIGANYAAEENLDYYANYSTGFRAPSVEQLFVGGNSPTSRVLPNSDLTPEYAYNIEFGLRAKAQWFGVPVDVDAAIFQIDRKDHIQASSGQYTTGPGNVYENAADMRNRGFEISVRSDFARKWSWDVAYTYLDAEYTKYDLYNLATCTGGVTSSGSCAGWTYTPYDNAGNVVPRTPNHHLNVAVHYRPSGRWLLTGEMDAISSYYADEINQEKVDGHETFNFLINYDAKRGRYAWSVFVRIDNVFAQEYYNTVRGYYDSNYDSVYDEEDLSIVVNQGRTYAAGLSVQF